MAHLLERLRRLLSQNAIRLSAHDLPPGLRPELLPRPGDRLEIGPRRFRVGDRLPGVVERFRLLPESRSGTDPDGATADEWTLGIDGSTLVLGAPDGASFRWPVRDVLIFPASE